MVHLKVKDENYQRSPLIEGGLEIPVEVMCEMDDTPRNIYRRTGNFLPGGGGGGGKPFAQKSLASCPNFYKTDEQKRGPYDATT